jgi:DNA ligase-4
MAHESEHDFNAIEFKTQIERHGHDLGMLPGWMFESLVLYMDMGSTAPSADKLSELPKPIQPIALRFAQASYIARFAGARTTVDITDEGITHIVVGEDRSRLTGLREIVSRQVDRVLLLDVS